MMLPLMGNNYAHRVSGKSFSVFPVQDRQISGSDKISEFIKWELFSTILQLLSRPEYFPFGPQESKNIKNSTRTKHFADL